MAESRIPLEQRIRERAYHIWESEGRPEGQAEAHWDKARRIESEMDARLDEAVQQSFPASDPPGTSPITGIGRG
ncbi:MAG: DUF2934 domain-containing protein [Paracraurococcus sp.]|jgi:hypothetical protein